MARPRVVTDAERRARLGLRHALAQPVAGVADAARAVVCLHATEPASVHLSARARCGATREAVDEALYASRSLVKQLAMRRTVFALPRDLVPAVVASAAARVARQQRDLLARSVVEAGISTDGSAWVEAACGEVVAELRRAPATTAQLRACLPVLQARVRRPEGPAAAGAPVAPRVLVAVAATGAVVRGHNEGGWTTSRPVWTAVEHWLGTAPAPVSPEEGYAEVVERWLWAYGPGTEADLVWWLGATKAAVRRALADVESAEVALEDGTPAWLHRADVDPVAAPDGWTALLPALDPTAMGWRGRSWYVDAEVAGSVFDRSGNARPTAWHDGRIVGGWHQDDDGVVVVEAHADLPSSVAQRLVVQAGELTDWLGGTVIRTSTVAARPHP